jgi:hypothetical protein
MRKFLSLPAVILLIVLLLPTGVEARAYTEVFHSGKIDWLKGTAEAVGIAIPARDAAKPGQPKAKPAVEAEKAGRRNLLELMGKLKIDSKTSMADLFSQSESLKKQVQLLVQKVPVQRVRNRKDGGVEATLRIELSGALAELLLPEDIRNIDSVQPKVQAENAEKAFSGLIVDCSGVRVRPAMSPRVFDEDGQMVYGPPYISREHAVKDGVARYARDLATSKTEGRVASRPLTVKAIRTAHTGSSDVVISNADAARVKAVAGNLRSLQRCRVLFVLD